mgnify:CR=1 FL=1
MLYFITIVLFVFILIQVTVIKFVIAHAVMYHFINYVMEIKSLRKMKRFTVINVVFLIKILLVSI